MLASLHILRRNIRPVQWPVKQHSEINTLALFGQLVHFPSKRACYRYAEQQLREASPQLPDRTPFILLMRDHHDAITSHSLYLVELMQAYHCLYEVLKRIAAVTHDAR